MRPLADRSVLISFSPLVSTTGSMGNTVIIVYKRIAQLIADKQSKPYSKALYWLRCRPSFRCLVQQSCASEGQYHESTILSTHPLPPWRWPVLRAGSKPVFKTLHAKQNYLALTLSRLLHCCMHDRYFVSPSAYIR